MSKTNLLSDGYANERTNWWWNCNFHLFREGFFLHPPSFNSFINYQIILNQQSGMKVILADNEDIIFIMKTSGKLWLKYTMEYFVATFEWFMRVFIQEETFALKIQFLSPIIEIYILM